MDTPIANEQQLLAEIDQLRERFPQTQELYREVCTLLFFRYGATPTANKLYQLVRKGSMSAPAEALTKFWSDLREKSRVRIEHPDLPESLKLAAGDMAAALWMAAQEQAFQSLAAYRADSEAAIVEAKESLAKASSERDMAIFALEKSQENVGAMTDQISRLQQALAASEATNASLTEQLHQAKHDHETNQQRLEEARKEFSAQLDKLREAGRLADERSQAAEKRALLEIDRERQAGTRLQKELEAQRLLADKTAVLHRAEIDSLQSQIGNLRQQLGALESKLQEALEAKRENAEELKAVTSKANDLSSHAISIRAEMQAWRIRAEAAEEELREIAKKKAVKRSPKATPEG